MATHGYQPLTIDVQNIPGVVDTIARLTGERDRARDTAVRLEQENARLEDLLAGVARDLREMHADEIIDLESWPTACDVVIHVFVEDRFAEVPS